MYFLHIFFKCIFFFCAVHPANPYWLDVFERENQWNPDNDPKNSQKSNQEEGTGENKINNSTFKIACP